MRQDIEQNFLARQVFPPKVILSESDSKANLNLLSGTGSDKKTPPADPAASKAPVSPPGPTEANADDFDQFSGMLMNLNQVNTDENSDFLINHETEMYDVEVGDDDDQGFELADGVEWLTDQHYEGVLSDDVGMLDSGESSGEIPLLDTSDDGDDAYSLQQSAITPLTAEVEENNSEIDETFDDVDPEMSEFLTMVIREDAAEYARERRRLKTLANKTGKITQQIPNGFLVMPPCKCCLVKVRYGQMGESSRCPKCKSMFMVPTVQVKRTRTIESRETSPEQSTAQQVTNQKLIALVAGPAPYKLWLELIYMHRYLPQKVKVATGTLQKLFIPVDVGFSDDDILIVQYAKKPGAYTREDKRIEKLRKEIRQLITEGKPVESGKEYDILRMPVGWLSSLQIISPMRQEDQNPEHPFKQTAVFGENRIALKLPMTDDGEELTFSFCISEYRGFVSICLEEYGYVQFSKLCSIGMDPELNPTTCPLSDKTYNLIVNTGYYLNDSFVKVTKVGGVCESCDTFVSTEGEKIRRDEITKLLADSKAKKKPASPVNKGIAGLAAGGPLPQLPAKGKCYLCNKKFGDHPSYIIESDATPAASSADSKSAEGTSAVANSP
jgi:predicted Zn-ribbon and HTH transcriptional regulator